MQEINLAYHYPKLFWDSAVLVLESGSAENDLYGMAIDETGRTNSTEYGKMARAIANIQKHGTKVEPPRINEAHFSFRPNLKNGSILFGLKGINGLGDEVVDEIVKNRPYDSLQDFLDKNFQVGAIIKKTHIIQLIKGGAFDVIEGKSREEIMNDFVKLCSEPRTTLNMRNINGLLEADLIPKDYQLEFFFYEHRRRIRAMTPYKVIPNTNPKVKKKIDDRYFRLTGKIMEFFVKHYSDDCIVETLSNGDIVISEVESDKEYDDFIDPLREYIGSSKQLLEDYNNFLFQQEKENIASGGVPKWEMDSLSYYYGEHELADVDRELYGITSYGELSPEPEIVGWNNYRGKNTPKFAITRIMGTVLEKNDIKHTVTILTPENEVVIVKFYDGAFAHYNRQVVKHNKDGSRTIVERSWFSRGEKLLLAGFRRGDMFYPRKYADTIYRHTTSKILDVDEEGKLEIQAERLRGD